MTSDESASPKPPSFADRVRTAVTAEVASSGDNIVVVAIYALPKDTMLHVPNGSSHSLEAPPRQPLGGQYHIPPGGQSAIYRFPLASQALHGPQLITELSERFRKASEVQTVIAISNTLFVDAIHHKHQHGIPTPPS